MAFCDDDQDESNKNEESYAYTEEVTRSLRFLGLKASYLLHNTQPIIEHHSDETTENRCWGFIGNNVEQKINSALRNTLRDLKDDKHALALVSWLI